MNGSPEQLSFLDVDGPGVPEPRKSEPKRPMRQQTTQRDNGPKGVERPAPTPAAATPALLTTEESAALLHVHPRTVQRLVERGELCAVHLGSAVRFDPRDIVRLVERVKSGGRIAPASPDPIPRGRRGASVSFGERLRSQRHEHRAAQA
jgi:excisionase family DNA binding protein